MLSIILRRRRLRAQPVELFRHQHWRKFNDVRFPPRRFSARQRLQLTAPTTAPLPATGAGFDSVGLQWYGKASNQRFRSL